jgi:hypothetical protein
MGLFNLFKKSSAVTQNEKVKARERLENDPEVLIFKLLFLEKPQVNIDAIATEVQRYFTNCNHSGAENTFLFSFPDFEVNLIDVTGPAQCALVINEAVTLPDVAFQQNWHWENANETARKCKYEVLVTDLLSRTLPYKQRLNIIMNFLVAVSKALNPDAIYSIPAQKIIDPQQLINKWSQPESELLYGICNVRLYNITEAKENELLMDTIGLNSLGLPDFQVRFSEFEASTIANLLWNNAYYIYEQGDVIEDGNTIEGIANGSKWKCERSVALIGPERVVLNIQAN